MTDIKEIQKIIGLQKLYMHTIETCIPNWKKLKEMDEFLNIYGLPKSNQDEINNLKRLIILNEIEAVI